MNQSEVWTVSLGPTRGSEIQKTRPALIVNDAAFGRLPLKIIVPFTDWKEHYSLAPWMVQVLPDVLNGIAKESAADCFQIRSVSDDRFVRRLGYVDAAVMNLVREAIALVLSIG